MSQDVPEVEIPFEQALDRLEKLVRKMEQGDAPLTELMRNFEEGKALSDVCERRLQDFERKIQILVRAPNGSESWTDFEERRQPSRQA